MKTTNPNNDHWAGKFEMINHTADVGIITYGKTLAELFENAAFGMFSLITPIYKVKEKILISISLDAHDYEELLITYLNEILYYYSTKKVLFKRFEILELNEIHLDAFISGEQISNYEIVHDIKAATYHNLKIEKITNGTYRTQIIFDL